MYQLYAIVTTMEKKKQRRSLLAGRFLIVILLLLMALYGFFTGPIRYAVTNDFLLGGLISMLVVFAILGAFFMLIVLLAGPHVLPVNSRDRREVAAARRVLFRFALGRHVAMAVVREGVVEPGPDSESREQVGGTGVIDVDSTSAVTLHTAIGFSRVEGTGLVFTHEAERLMHIIDLRIQLRTQDFEFLTRDGLPIKVRLSVRFQIDRTEFNRYLHAHDPQAPYPRPLKWSSYRVELALSRLPVVDGEGNFTPWSERVLGIAQGMLRAIIATYTLDGLLEPQDPTRNPRQEIRVLLNRQITPFMAQRGIRIVSVAVGVIFPADFDAEKTFDQQNPVLDRITERRIKVWKSEYESRMIRVTAEGQAEADRRRDLARTQAQMELIMRVTQALEQGAPAIIDNQDQIARRFLETLQKMANEPYTRARLPEDNIMLLGAALGQRDQMDSYDLGAALGQRDQAELHEPPPTT
jgi:regulator of protease activity HflC (stomatin/prohibitin superfamily)